jgi:hypothetical protein
MDVTLIDAVLWNRSRVRTNHMARVVTAEIDLDAGRPPEPFLPSLAQHRAATRREQLARVAERNGH